MNRTIPSDPSAAGAADPAQDQQHEPGQGEAASSGAPEITAGAATRQPAEGNADADFNAFQAENEAPANNPESTATDPAAAPAKEAEQPEGASPESQAAPQAKDGTQPPAAPEKDVSDPTPAERASGMVPVKKLERALEGRRRFKDQTAKLETELNQERQFSDKLLSFYDRAGITQDQVPAFMEDLLLVSQGNAEAQQRMASRLKLAPAPAETDEKVIEELVKRAADYGDADAVLNEWRNKRSSQAAAAKPPPKPPQAPVPTAPAAGASQPDPGMVQLGGQIKGMADSLVATFGKEEANKIGETIEARAGSELERLQRMGVQITPKVVGNVYRDAHGHALAHREQRRAPTRPVRSTQPAPVAQKVTADQRFDDFLAEG